MREATHTTRGLAMGALRSAVKVAQQLRWLESISQPAVFVDTNTRASQAKARSSIRFLSNLVAGDMEPLHAQWQILKEKERAAQAMMEHAKEMKEHAKEMKEMLQEKEGMMKKLLQEKERIIQEEEFRIKDKESVIRERDHRIRALEFELLKSNGTNNLRGLVELFEEKFTDKYAEMLELLKTELGRTGLRLTRQDRWSLFCRLDSTLSQCFERNTGWHGHEEQGAGVVEVYRILSSHVHDGKKLPLLQNLDGKTWAIPQNPLTYSQASAVVCMAEALTYSLTIVSEPEIKSKGISVKCLISGEICQMMPDHVNASGSATTSIASISPST